MPWIPIKIKEETKNGLDKKKTEYQKKGLNPSYDDLIRETDLVEETEEKDRDMMELFK